MELNRHNPPVPGALTFLLIAIPLIGILSSLLYFQAQMADNSGHITLTVIIGVLLIITTGFLITYLLFDQWVKFYREKYETEPARRRAEEELEKWYSLLKATIESTADGLLVVDNNSKVVLYNRKFSEMWKISEEVLDSNEDFEFLEYVKDQLLTPEKFTGSVRNFNDDALEITSDVMECADGRVFERYSQPQVISGSSIGRVWSFRDITGKKKAEMELIAAKEKAEEGDRLKTAFLHNVSHEIRTPMNAIIGFCSLLNEPGLTTQERCQYAGIISQSSSQLLSIINDIVDIANVESGQIKPNITGMNLNLALKQLNEQFSYKGSNIRLNLSMALADDDSVIKADNTKLVQVLSNLISNALKFTREGSIDFGYVIKDREIEFFVIDTGIGIAQEHIDRIFDRFYQVDDGGNRQYGGTGLGLSICKAYIGLLGGNIWVESSPGQGARFRFTIPFIR